jgi:hypothetical protein
MDSKQIRQELKKALGYNARQVSVKQSPYAVVFTVRDPFSVNFEAVKEFSKTFENVRYDERTQCILRGGNTFVEVRLAQAVKDEFKAAWLPILEAVAKTIVANTLEEIPGTDFLLGKDQMHDGCWTLWKKEGRTLRFYDLHSLAVELGLKMSQAAELPQAARAEEAHEPEEAIQPDTGEDEEEHEELNSYELRQQARRERYEELAEKNDARSDGHYREARRIGDFIPFGQPILVGHHSEGRARRDAARITSNMDRSVEANRKADYYRNKAENVGNAGISSDDPAALKKLREKLAGMESAHALMKAINNAWRAAGKPDATNLEGWKKVAQAPKVKAHDFQKFDELRQSQANPWFAGRAPFPAYTLSNNNANMQRVKDRIKSLEQRQSRPEAEDISGTVDGEGFTLHENTELNRLQILFDGKPAEEIRTTLKRHGFRWSPREKAWQRQLNQGARNAAQSVLNLH